MTIRRRTFPEVLDNLLVAMTGGSAAEAHPFPPPGSSVPPFQHLLQQPPAADVISLYGSRDGQPHLFRKGVDYKLADNRLAVEWQPGARLPDPGSLVSINYYPNSAQPVLTDLQTGSVVRTLAETVALEMAGLYAQLEAVYQSSFVDTAGGSSLDKVVALLGITRVAGGRAAGEVEFSRAPNSRGAITLPAGTRITTAGGDIEYETTATVTMAPPQNTIRVVARDLEPNDPLPADVLTVLPVPIDGIATVTNPAPTTVATQDETDTELRERAKNFLYGSERATLGALKNAVSRQGLTAEVEEDADEPGLVRVIPHVDPGQLPPELYQRLLQAIEDARPAGVRVVLDLARAVAPQRVDLAVRLTTTKSLLEQDLRAAQRAVRESVADYFARLPTASAASINRIVGLALSVAGVEDVRILSAQVGGVDKLNLAAGTIDIAGAPTVLGELQIADPNLPTLLNAVVIYPSTASPPDRPAIQSALDGLLTALNALNASDSTTPDERTLTYSRLLAGVPLPGIAATPDPGEATIAPYAVRFAITAESGLSRILARQSDAAYTLAPFERISLGGVELQTENGDG